MIPAKPQAPPARVGAEPAPAPSRRPRHVGLIPDGNRRWADARGLPREDGYAAGIEPGVALLEECRALGIPEVSIYGFTRENVRRASVQVRAFRAACVAFARRIVERGAALRVVGDMESPVFPRELTRYAERCAGSPRVNLLVNYGWQWDLEQAQPAGRASRKRPSTPAASLASAGIPRVDLVVRWGGRSRLSGFLPLQCAYADLFVVDALWPDMTLQEFHGALAWYAQQEVTLGG
jgi:undecaprenyl diphosphate synthase